jgi:hypothetical protein
MMGMSMSNVIALESYRPKATTPTQPRPTPRSLQLWHQRQAEWTLDKVRRHPQIGKLVNDREAQFLTSMTTWTRPLSDKQKIWLHDITSKTKLGWDKLVASQPTPPGAA